MKKFNVRVLAEIAIFAAIGFVLDILQGGIWKGVFANGGSIGFAMVPVFVISYRRGLLPGILCGLILSLVQMLGGIYVINSGSMDGWKGTAGPFIQVMLDYALAYTVVGVAGAFSAPYHKKSNKLVWLIVGCVVGGLLKYLCHSLSGIFFWPGEWWGVSGTYSYSLLYNGLYCIPNIIVCTAVMVVLHRFYPQFLNVEDADSSVFEANDETKEEM